MRILPTCLFLSITINIITAQIFQGHAAGQTREKRSNNIYQFVRHVIATSNFPQKNFHNIPQDYSAPTNQRVVVNVNQADSRPTTIINNLHPEYLSACPCEKYVRGYYGEIGCLCPRQKIYTKCDSNKVCIEKGYCDHGLLFDVRVLQTVNRQIDLCDESTHVCCLPPSEVRHESTWRDHQVSNHFIKSSVDRLNNTVTKYFIGGNLYVNNGHPTKQFDTQNKEVQLLVPVEENTQPVQTSFSSISEGERGQNEAIGTGSGINQNLFGGQVPPGNEQFPSTAEYNSQFVPAEEKNPVHLQSITTTTEMLPRQQTIPPKLVRPTRPPTESTNPVVQSKAKDQQSEITNDITTFRPSTTTQVTVGLLDPNEIASIFGLPDVTEFPDLPLDGVNLNSAENTNGDSNQKNPEIGVSIIENAPLSMMDFPQPGFQPPMKRPETFLTGKIERFRMKNRTNSTTTSSISTPSTSVPIDKIVPGVTQRIFIEGSSNVRPTAPAFTQVQEQEMFSFQEAPTNQPSNFSQTPTQTVQILRSCPSAMKCVQEMYCTPEGMVSTVPVILTKEEEVRKNKLLTCGDEASGQIGKCCFDKFS